MLTTGRQRGFNLIEAAVTVSILGILLAASLPSMSDWIRATRLRSMAETTQTGLQRARNEAMKQNKVVTFWLVTPADTSSPDGSCALSAASAAWVVSVDDPTGKCDASPSASANPRIVQTYGPGKTADGITVAAADGSGTAVSSVSFNGFGQRVGTMASIDFTNSASTTVRPMRIQISVSGGVRMCDPWVTVASPNDPRACNP